ncbi:MAG: cyclic nucleotide-binding domain-containing protein, partial [Anaerolineae bacterium]|nr:cyclic nucleotide-binding domain-containing protein [Anaerolineae bacterium]
MTITDSVARLGRFRLFAGLSEAELIQAGNWFEEKSAHPSEVLYHQGAMPDFLYLVESGQIVEVGRDAANQVILRRVAEPGDLVGRRSMLENVQHQATATVQQNAQLLAISSGNLRLLLNTLPALRDRLQRTDVVGRLMAMPLFGGFDQEQLTQIADLVRVVEYPAGQVISRQGDMASAMYAIDTGQVAETRDSLPAAGGWIRYRAAGHFFGQEELKRNTPYQTTTLASTDVVLFRINRDGLDWLLRLQPQFNQALNPPPVADWLAKTGLFAKLSELEREYLVGFVGLAHYAPGEAIFRQGEKDQTLYILYEGEALIRALNPEGKERPRGYAYPGAEFGERSAFLDESHSLTVESVTPSNWLYTHHDDLERYLTRYPESRDKLVFKPAIQARQQLKRFKWMDRDEQLQLRERRHWAALLRRLTAPGALVLLGLGLLALLTKSERALFRALDISAIILALLWFAWNFIDWLNDYFILTTKRVAHRERLLLIRETRDEAPLDKVQNVNIEQRFWGNMLGFGALVIDTAATYGGGRVRFDYLTNPEKVQRSIFEEMSRTRAGERHEVRRVIRDKLAAGVGSTLQPRIPPIATAPLATALTPHTRDGLRRRVAQLPRLQPVWTERKTDDQVIWRKHPIRLIIRVWIPALGIAVVLAAAAALLLSGAVPFSWPLLAALAPILSVLIFWFWWQFSNWGNDQYIVTND